MKPNTVTVLGEVLTPSALAYIKQAGGRIDNILFVVHANRFTKKGDFKI